MPAFKSALKKKVGDVYTRQKSRSGFKTAALEKYGPSVDIKGYLDTKLTLKRDWKEIDSEDSDVPVTYTSEGAEVGNSEYPTYKARPLNIGGAAGAQHSKAEAEAFRRRRKK